MTEEQEHEERDERGRGTLSQDLNNIAAACDKGVQGGLFSLAEAAALAQSLERLSALVEGVQFIGPRGVVDDGDSEPSSVGKDEPGSDGGPPGKGKVDKPRSRTSRTNAKRTKNDGGNKARGGRNTGRRRTSS